MEIKKYNILVITELFPNQEYPYLGSFVYNQLDYLKKYYNITVIAPRFLGFKLFYPKKINENDFTIHNIRQPILPLSIIRRLFNINKSKISSMDKYFIHRKIIRLAKRINKNTKIDLIIGHESGIGDEACFIGNQLNIPSIFHLHGLFNYHQTEFGKNKIDKIILNIEKANQIISVSNIAIESYKQHGLKNKNISIIPNLVNPPKEDSLINEEWGNIIKNKKVILSIGWFVKEKRIEQIIELANNIKDRDDFVVLIIGQGKKEKYYNQLIEEFNLKNKVYIVGPITPEKISFFYQNCYVLIHPSIIDSFSMVCLEAMSYHKPIICTKNIGITEYIKNNKEAFTIDPDNQEQLKEKTLILLNNPELEKNMGENACQTSQKFYKEIIGEKIKTIYDREIQSYIK
jgi:glycosyltransferase involved in cell wall biosynthesis